MWTSILTTVKYRQDLGHNYITSKSDNILRRFLKHNRYFNSYIEHCLFVVTVYSVFIAETLNSLFSIYFSRTFNMWGSLFIQWNSSAPIWLSNCIGRTNRAGALAALVQYQRITCHRGAPSIISWPSNSTPS